MKPLKKIFLTVILLLCLTPLAHAQTLKGPALASDRTDSAPPAAPAATEPAQDSRSFLHLLTLGGWAMFPLAACSLLGLALIIERSLALRRSNLIPTGFMAGLERIYRTQADTKAAVDYCRKNPSTLARIMAAGIRKLPLGDSPAETAIADQGATEVARLRKNLRLLHGIAALTPTIGLLGTVWGMIRAFEGASRVGLGSHSEALTTGIYEALVATMSGLMIAAPVLLAYYIFLGIIDRTVLELNDTCQSFLEHHENPRNTAAAQTHIDEPEPTTL